VNKVKGFHGKRRPCRWFNERNVVKGASHYEKWFNHFHYLHSLCHDFRESLRSVLICNFTFISSLLVKYLSCWTKSCEIKNRNLVLQLTKFTVWLKNAYSQAYFLAPLALLTFGSSTLNCCQRHLKFKKISFLKLH